MSYAKGSSPPAGIVFPHWSLAEGSFIPFARTKAERAKAGDPRLLVEERYASKQVYFVMQ